MQFRSGFLIVVFIITACNGRVPSEKAPSIDSTGSAQRAGDKPATAEWPEDVREYYIRYRNDSDNSISYGTEAKGNLINGKLLPFSGPNFRYFDKGSYLSHRAFVNHRVEKILILSYRDLRSVFPTKLFYVMECSFRYGGKLAPHKTHQNGLSVDFMMPLLKKGKPYSDLDTIGLAHYFLEFDNSGRLVQDTSVIVDFNTLAAHIYYLNENVRKYRMKIKKVIIKTQFREKLFATEYGKKLKHQQIYFVRALSDYTNGYHDEHYHIDFE